MFTVQVLAEALLTRDVTVATLAPTLGTVEKKLTDEYRVKPTDPSVLAVSLTIPEGKDALAPPSVVVVYYAADPPVRLGAAVAGCTGWKMIPGNPGASPYLYHCLFPGSSEHLEVAVIATLTDDIKSPEARLQKLVLQRNAW